MSKVLKLCAYSLALYVFFAFIGPQIISLSPTWQALNNALEENNVEGGALFYTEIPFIEEAEQAVRDGVEKGMALRKEGLAH